VTLPRFKPSCERADTVSNVAAEAAIEPVMASRIAWSGIFADLAVRGRGAAGAAGALSRTSSRPSPRGLKKEIRSVRVRSSGERERMITPRSRRRRIAGRPGRVRWCFIATITVRRYL
jgi:hypothetical protein